jgi:uroporphyrinogen decarboxylase
MSNIKFQNALRRIPQRTPPIWLMRQAGRYHKHYQALRAQHSFMDLCKKPKLAAEVALGPIADFDFDVSILFSDLLFPLEAMGMGLTYDPGPKLGWHLEASRMRDLIPAHKAIEALQFQKEAMLETRKILPEDKSLIGFVGGPWTLFAYAMEGGHKGELQIAKKNINLFKQFCDILVPLLIDNIKLQLAGGAELVLMIDTAAGELSPQVFKFDIIPQLEKIVSHFHHRVAYYGKNIQGAHISHNLFESNRFAGLGVDHRWHLPDLLKQNKSGFIQGNFDQSLLFLSEKEFSIYLERYTSDFLKLTEAERAGWVCGLGHGVLPATPENNVRTFVRTIREVFA